MEEFDNGLGEKFQFDMNAPVDSEVSLDSLKKFLKKGDTLIFYGGEPLIKIDKIKAIIDEFENKGIKFCMQTNGKLLNEIPEKYLPKFSKILVSLDGDEERTDFNRGKGNYENVINNLKFARENGFKGEIVARMTISFPDIFKQTLHLTKLIDEKLIDSVHWQIDAGFYGNDFNEKVFSKFVKEYNSEISKLINFWIEEMNKGKVLKFYPFLGIFEAIHYNKEMKLQCGSGHSNYTITTSGKLSACPIVNSIKDFYAGDLNNDIKDLKKFEMKEPCASCSDLKYCGGRCLYWNYTKLWPESGDKLICNSVKHLIQEIKRVLPTINQLIEKGIIIEKDFEFERYFGPEIIP